MSEFNEFLDNITTPPPVDLTAELAEILQAIERGWIQSFGNTLVYRCADGEPLCGGCVSEKRDLIKEATQAYFSKDTGVLNRDLWAIVGVESAAEYEKQACAHCYTVLE